MMNVRLTFPSFLLFVLSIVILLAPTSVFAWPLEDDTHGDPVQVEDSLLLSPNAEKAKASLAKAAGSDLQAMRIFVYPDRARFIVKTGVKEKAPVFQEYAFAEGELKDPLPVDFMKKDIRFEKLLFAVNEVPFEKFSTLVAMALEKLKLKNGNVTHLMIGKDIVDGGASTIRAFLLGQDKEGHVDFSFTGEVLGSESSERLRYEVDPHKSKR